MPRKTRPSAGAGPSETRRWNREDGQPYCCGERMNVKGGIVGVDYAKCAGCGIDEDAA